MDAAATVAVLDVGKSNVKLSAVTTGGAVHETLSVPNSVRPGPPWAHHDLAGLTPWILDSLGALCRRHPVRDVIASGHGSGCVLVGEDPDAGGDGAVLPMIDYEQPLPAGLAEAYAPLAGPFADRGSAVMMAATHSARQMFWAERDRPDAFAAARWVLGVPQYWAWRLSGVAAGEASILGAQSHLWNVRAAAPSALVEAQGWTRLMPPMRRARDVLGPIRPALARRHGLPATLSVRVGAHDSALAFHRYQAAGIGAPCVVSTGTWIVALAEDIPDARLDEARGMTLNADVEGRPLGGALAMGGREFSAVAGQAQHPGSSDPARIARLVEAGSMALPMFGSNDGQYPGAGGAGRLVGPPLAGAADRLALAVMYAALLTWSCGSRLAADRPWVLDGSFLSDPAFAPLVAALRPERPTGLSAEPYGIAAGAALLCRDRTGPVPIDLSTPAAPGGGLDPARWRAYAARWADCAEGQTR